MTDTRTLFPFDAEKAVEVVAELLRLSDGLSDRFTIIKCVYLAERESLARRERPICGGYYVSMKDGPVHSEVYDLIKRGGMADWDAHIEAGQGDDYSVSLVREHPPFLLSESELAILGEVHARFADMNFRQLWHYVHDARRIPEYSDPSGSGSGSRAIAAEDLFRALGKADEAGRIMQEARVEREIDEALPRAM